MLYVLMYKDMQTCKKHVACVSMYYIEQNVTCHKPMQEVKRLVHKHATVGRHRVLHKMSP